MLQLRYWHVSMVIAVVVLAGIIVWSVKRFLDGLRGRGRRGDGSA